MNKKILIALLLLAVPPLSVKGAANSFTANNNFLIGSIKGNDITAELVAHIGSTASSWSVSGETLTLDLEEGSSFKLGSNNSQIASFSYNNDQNCVNINPAKGYAELNYIGSSIVKPQTKSCGGGSIINTISHNTQVSQVSQEQTPHPKTNEIDPQTPKEISEKKVKVLESKTEGKINLTNIPNKTQTIGLMNISDSKITNVEVNLSKNILNDISYLYGTSNDLKVNVISTKTSTEQTKNIPANTLLADDNLIDISLEVGDKKITKFLNYINISFDISKISNKANVKVYYLDTVVNEWKLAGNGGTIVNNMLKVDLNHLTLFALINTKPTAEEKLLNTKVKNAEKQPAGGGTPINVPKVTTPSIAPQTAVQKGADTKQEIFFKKILEDIEVIIESGHKLDSIIAYNNATKNVANQIKSMNQYTIPLTKDVSELSINDIYAINNFIVYGTRSTNLLGEEERASIIHTYKANYDKVPVLQKEWEDILRIANGIWPNKRSSSLETKANSDFKKIYSREPNLQNPSDNTAITMIAYGLRPSGRDLSVEQNALNIFRTTYRKNPQTTHDWDIIRAIAYSGVEVNAVKTPTTSMTKSSCSEEIEFIGYLRTDSISKEIRRLQELLKCLGYFPSDQDSTAIFGEITFEAVKKFQTANNLVEVGFVGPKTRTALNRYVK
ncbi:peptidoglycan-binding protein [Patescibacteria group bacterium]|nr:peptidoglycan-binding protein [Patescibacteria group bacterium]